MFTVFACFCGWKTLIFACPASVLEGFSFFPIFSSKMDFAWFVDEKRNRKLLKIIKNRIEKPLRVWHRFFYQLFRVFYGFSLILEVQKPSKNHAKINKISIYVALCWLMLFCKVFYRFGIDLECILDGFSANFNDILWTFG